MGFIVGVCTEIFKFLNLGEKKNRYEILVNFGTDPFWKISYVSNALKKYVKLKSCSVG